MNNTDQEEIKASSSADCTDGGLSTAGSCTTVHVGKPAHCAGELFSWGEDGLRLDICNDPHSRPGPEPPRVDIWNNA